MTQGPRPQYLSVTPGSMDVQEVFRSDMQSYFGVLFFHNGLCSEAHHNAVSRESDLGCKSGRDVKVGFLTPDWSKSVLSKVEHTVLFKRSPRVSYKSASKISTMESVQIRGHRVKVGSQGSLNPEQRIGKVWIAAGGPSLLE